MSDIALFEERQLTDIIPMIRRRVGLAAIVGAAIAAAVIAVAMLLPSVFRSSGTILIEAPDIPSDLVRTTVSGYADQRLKVIEQRVMTTQNLAAIIEKFGLYQNERARRPMALIVDDMRKDIGLELVSADVSDPSSGRTRRATIAFTVWFEDQRPDIAQRVANELVTLYLSENLRVRQEQATGTVNFLSAESRKVYEELRALEKQLADFKVQHAGRLPEQFELNTQLLDRMQGQLLELMRQMQALRERQAYLQAQMAGLDPYLGSGDGAPQSPQAQLRALELQYTTLSARFGVNHPDVLKVRRQIEALSGAPPGGASTVELSNRLTQLEADLTAARERFGVNHPDVVRLQREIDQTREAIARARAAPPKLTDLPPTNPAYLQAQAQLNSMRIELQSLETQEKNMRERAAEFEKRVLETPDVESAYVDLRRQYESALARYRDVSAKESEAQIAQTLESERKGETFSIIEPPSQPMSPHRPNRPLLAVAGVILGLMGGVAVAGAAGFLSGQVYGARQIAALTGEPPLAVVPYLRTADEGRRMRQRLIIAALLALIALIAVAAYIHFFKMPLDLYIPAQLNRLLG